MDKEYLKLAADAVQAKLPDNHGFILLTTSVGPGENRMHYVSTLHREDAINVLKEFLIKAGAEEDWMRHLP